MKIQDHNLEQLLRFKDLAGCNRCNDERSNWTIVKDYTRLLRASRKLELIDTHVCNGTRYSYDDGTYDKAIETALGPVKHVCEAYSLSFYHQGDPRGASLHVSNHELHRENYSSLGLAIY